MILLDHIKLSLSFPPLPHNSLADPKLRNANKYRQKHICLHLFLTVLVDYFLSDLPELLRADLPVPVPVEEGEGLLQALDLLDADVTVGAGLVLHDEVTITRVTCPQMSRLVSAITRLMSRSKMREKFNF